jgi:hypothetical protein
MITSRASVGFVAGIGVLFAISAASTKCCAVIVYYDGGPSVVGTAFLDAANWNPDGVPGNNLVDTYSIDDGFASTLSGGNTLVNALRVGSTAKEHQLGETHFGRLTMTGGSLGIIGSNLFAIGRERENVVFGGDYNKNGVLDAADYILWRKTLGSTSKLAADGDGNGTIEQPDYTYWKTRFGNRVKGGEVILTGSSSLAAYGALIGERTKAFLSVGPSSVVDIRIWDTTVTPNQFGGTEDMRVGGYGPAYDDFGGEPGLDGDGLVDVQGTLNAKDVYLSEHGGKGEIRLSGGAVNLNGTLHMDFCGNCVTDPALLGQRSSKISIVGSTGSFKVGLDPDPLAPTPLPPPRDLLAASTTATFSFTADAGGITPIVIAQNVLPEPSGTAYINGSKLQLNLDAYTSSTPLVLINAPALQLIGTFGSVTFLGNRIATVNYDTANGDVFLSNFHLGPGAGAGAVLTSAVPEPSSMLLVALAMGLLLFMNCRTDRRAAHCWGNKWQKVRA